MQCLVYGFVGYVGTVELGGVNVIDAGIDGTPPYRQRALATRWWTEYPGTGELHGPEADPMDRKAGEKDGIEWPMSILALSMATFHTTPPTHVANRLDSRPGPSLLAGGARMPDDRKKGLFGATISPTCGRRCTAARIVV